MTAFQLVIRGVVNRVVTLEVPRPIVRTDGDVVVLFDGDKDIAALVVPVEHLDALIATDYMTQQ